MVPSVSRVHCIDNFFLAVKNDLLSEIENSHQKNNEFIISRGFIFHADNMPKEDVYEGGIWPIYYLLEQNVAVAPEIRKFLKGDLILLFRLGFNNDGELISLKPEELYLWYNIDEFGKPVVAEFVKVLRDAPGWKKNFSGELFIPLKFQTSGGRVIIDYTKFAFTPERRVRIGTK